MLHVGFSTCILIPPIRLTVPSRQDWGGLHSHLKGSQIFAARMIEGSQEIQSCRS